MSKGRGQTLSNSNLLSASTKPIKFVAKHYERPGLSEDEVIEIKQAFDLFDPEQTGKVNPRDLKHSLDSLGYEAQNQTIYQMISDIEAEGTGNIEFEQFLQLMTSRVSDKDSRENIKKVYNLFDQDKVGYITIKNLRKIVKQLGENIDQHQLQEMIDKADSNKDGMVSQDDFYQIITKKGSSSH